MVGAEIPTAFELGISKGTRARSSTWVGWRCVLFACSPRLSVVRPAASIRWVHWCASASQFPQVVTKGIELNTYGVILPGWSVNAGYIYDVAQYPNGYTGYDPNNLSGGTTNLSGLQLVGVPKNKLSLSSEYDFALAASVQAFFEADTVFKSAMRLGPTADPRFVYPGNWNTGLRVGVRSPVDTWSAALFVRNLSADHEPVTLFGGPSFTPPGANPGQPAGYVNGISGWTTPDSLRQVGVTLSAKF